MVTRRAAAGAPASKRVRSAGSTTSHSDIVRTQRARPDPCTGQRTTPARSLREDKTVKRFAISVMVPLAAALTFGAAAVFAQQPSAQKKEQPAADPARPRNPAANLPSDTGAQTTNPSGAVTGAGQPQGTTTQRDVGAPGGLERRARRDARAAGGTAAGGAAAGASDAGERAPGPQRSRARRASKG